MGESLGEVQRRVSGSELSGLCMAQLERYWGSCFPRPGFQFQGLVGIAFFSCTWTSLREGSGGWRVVYGMLRWSSAQSVASTPPLLDAVVFAAIEACKWRS